MAAVFPALSATASDDTARRTVLGARSFRWICFLLSTPVTVAILFSSDLMRLWMGPAFAVASAPILRILLVGIAANALARVPLSVLNARGRSDVTAKVQLVELPFQVVATVLFLRFYGLPGAAFCWTGRLVVETIVLFLFAGRLTGLDLGALFDSRSRYCAAALVLMASAAAGLLFVSHAPLLGFAVGFGLLAMGLSGQWLWYLTADDRCRILQTLQPCLVILRKVIRPL
jgi:O-antigen/teichoic acid export membrane protein